MSTGQAKVKIEYSYEVLWLVDSAMCKTPIQLTSPPPNNIEKLNACMFQWMPHGFNNDGPALREAGVVRGEDRDHGDRFGGCLHRFTPLKRQVGLLSLQREHLKI